MEILSTLAGIAVAFAGLASLTLVVVQLAGVQWQPHMTTGLWLLMAWSLGVLGFSIVPLLLRVFEMPDPQIVSGASFGLGIFIPIVVSLALRRDIRLARTESAAKPPFKAIFANVIVCAGVSLALLLNSFSVLPGRPAGWYVCGVFAILLFAIVPLAHIVALVHKEE